MLNEIEQAEPITDRVALPVSRELAPFIQAHFKVIEEHAALGQSECAMNSRVRYVGNYECFMMHTPLLNPSLVRKS